MSNVVTLREFTLDDIPALLRNLADQIEQGHADGPVENVVCIVDHGSQTNPSIYGWGANCDVPMMSYLMTCAQVHMASDRNA